MDGDRAARASLPDGHREWRHGNRILHAGGQHRPRRGHFCRPGSLLVRAGLFQEARGRRTGIRRCAPVPLRASAWEEKRSQPRLAVSWRAAFAGPRGSSPAQLKDISLGGAFVVCVDPLPLSERFLITMDLAGRGPWNSRPRWSGPTPMSRRSG
ncbi:MAG: PilZ domain-containing protein [Desulfobacterales bacterium]|nr:PilZ domain-containing protein [Desulfobacterales bacterium]